MLLLLGKKEEEEEEGSEKLHLLHDRLYWCFYFSLIGHHSHPTTNNASFSLFLLIFLSLSLIHTLSLITFPFLSHGHLSSSLSPLPSLSIYLSHLSNLSFSHLTSAPLSLSSLSPLSPSFYLPLCPLSLPPIFLILLILFSFNFLLLFIQTTDLLNDNILLFR